MKVDAVGLMTDGKKWYPIIFKEAPLPGGVTSPKRMKSMGHHTQGYSSREEAEKGIASDKLLTKVPRLKGDLHWGEDPAKVILVTDNYTIA